MVLGAQNVALEGEAVLYRSDNLIDWDFIGPSAGSQLNGLGRFGYMWECPDMFRLADQDVLVVSPQGLEPEGDKYQNLYQSGYFIGKTDANTMKLQHGEFTELDRGFDFYAPQTTLDDKGRRLLIAWMGMTDDMEKYHPTIEKNWIHALTIPRELKLVNNKIYQLPLAELTSLRADETIYPSIELEGGKMKQFPEVNGEALELLLEFNESVAGIFEINLKNNVKLTYDSTNRLFSLERKNFKDGKKEIRRCALEQLNKMHVFLDTTSIEVFLNDGEEVFTARFFSADKDQSITFSSNRTETFQLKKWTLNSYNIVEKA